MKIIVLVSALALTGCVAGEKARFIHIVNNADRGSTVQNEVNTVINAQPTTALTQVPLLR